MIQAQLANIPPVPLELTHRLLPWQREVRRWPQRFKVVIAGRRSGKTVLGIHDLVRGTRVPNSVNWYVGPTYGAAKDIAWGILKENFRDFHKYGLIDKVVESDLLIKLRNGAVVHLKGGDKPDSLRGVKLNRLVIDEYAIMKREIWDEVLGPATSDLKAPVIFIGTPKGYNHFYELYLMKDKNPADWNSRVIKTSEAGTISPEEIDRARRDMDARVFRQEYEASFETFGGQVFTDFDRKKHVTAEPFSFNPAWEYWIGMDFGWSAPTACALINISPTEDVWIFDEYDVRETPIPIIALKLKERAPIDKLTCIACDPAGDSKNESMGTSSVKELRNVFGWERVRYRSNYPGVIQDGVNQIRKWLRNGKLHISPKCTKTIQAFEMYRYPDPKGDVQSELPLKDGISDHHIDKLRYFFNIRFPARQSSIGAA